MTAIMTHGSKTRILAVFMVMSFMAVTCIQPVEAVKMRTIGAIAGGVGGAMLALGLWQLATAYIVITTVGGGVFAGLLIPAAMLIVPTVIGVLLGGGLGAWLDKKFGGSPTKIKLDPSNDF